MFSFRKRNMNLCNNDNNLCTENNPQKLSKESGRVRNLKSSGHHPDYSIIKFCQSIVKSPRNLRRLAITLSSERQPDNASVRNSQGIIIIIIWTHEQMVYAQPSICPRKEHTLTPMGLWHTNRSPNLGQKTRPYNDQQKKKKRIYKIVIMSRLTTG